MRTPKKRLFADSIFVSSKIKVGSDEFSIPLRNKLRGGESVLLNRFMWLNWVGIAEIFSGTIIEGII